MQLPQEVKVGIEFGSIAGIVSELESREAALYVGVTWKVWVKMGWWERACAVAQYRLHLLIDAHVHHAYDQAAKQKAASNNG